MLPFLKSKKQANANQTGVIVQERSPDKQNNQEDPGLIAAARDLIDAIHDNDAERVAKAFRAAFDLLEMLPHEEIEHEDEEQKIE